MGNEEAIEVLRYAVVVPMDDFNRMQRIVSLAGDLWNELENIRSLWENDEHALMIQDRIAAYEKATGIS